MQAPEVLYRGECIALIVAETLEAAQEAASRSARAMISDLSRWS